MWRESWPVHKEKLPRRQTSIVHMEVKGNCQLRGIVALGHNT